MLSELLLLLLLVLVGCEPTNPSLSPPTLPHFHHAHPVEHLDLATVKGVMQAIEHMWHDYTSLTNRSAESEMKLAYTEERLATSSRLCEVEKRALGQVHEVRVTGLERRLAAAKGEQMAQGVCSCELANCQHERDAEHHIAQALMHRLDSIWVDQSMENITLSEKSNLTLMALHWAREELAREVADRNRTASCHHQDATMPSPVTVAP